MTTFILINELMRSDLSKAKAASFEFLRWSQNLSDKRWMATAYVFLVNVYQQTGKPDSAEFFLDLLKNHAEKHYLNKRIRINYNHSASLFYKNQGNFRKALDLMKANLPLLTEKDEHRAGQLLNIGNTYIKLADYKNAVTYHLQSLELFQELGNKRGQSFCLQSLGSDFYNLGEYRQAHHYYQQSMALKEMLKDKRGIIIAQNGLGEALMALGSYEEAEKYYLKALSGAREMKLVNEEVKIHYNLGLLFREWSKDDKARAYFGESFKMASMAGDSLYMRNSKAELIRLDEKLQNKKEAEEMLQAGLSSAKASGDRKTELYNYKRLSDYYLNVADYEKAFIYLKQFEQLKDSIEGGEILLQITSMKEQYESEQKEKEILLLKKEQQLQSLAFSREKYNLTLATVVLAALLIIGILFINRFRVINRAKRLLEMERMRNSIARDLHDDIGSTLSSINIMSQLALKEHTGSNSSYFQRIHEQSAHIMESMSDIVWSINPMNDSFEQMLSKMKEFAGEILEPKNIQYSFEVDEEVLGIQLPVETRKNIFLIFKEALNNAAKYSKATDIVIEIRITDGRLGLSITDNGIGYDPVADMSGNGRRNMNERAVSIMGKLRQESAPGKGTRIQLDVPVT